MNNYRVVFVSDQALPEGQDWAIVECGDETVCVMKQSRISPDMLEEAWAAYRILLSVPAPRQPGEDESRGQRRPNLPFRAGGGAALALVGVAALVIGDLSTLVGFPTWQAPLSAVLSSLHLFVH